jgi:hypothetical protein
MDYLSLNTPMFRSWSPYALSRITSRVVGRCQTRKEETLSGFEYGSKCCQSPEILYTFFLRVPHLFRSQVLMLETNSTTRKKCRGAREILHAKIRSPSYVFGWREARKLQLVERRLLSSSSSLSFGFSFVLLGSVIISRSSSFVKERSNYSFFVQQHRLHAW